MGCPGDRDELVGRQARAARLRPVVDSVVPLAEVRAAMSRMAAGEQFGKLVLRIAE